MANILTITSRFNRVNDNSIYNISHKRIYKPIELELQKDGGFKVVKNSYQHYDEHQDFDKRQKYSLSSKNIFNGGLLSDDQEFRNLNRTRKLNVSKKLHQTMRIDQTIQHNHLGLLNALLYNCKENVNGETNKFYNDNRIKIMICITMYSEKLSELEKSLNGITKNIDYFLEIGIAPHQIAVTVIFDGIVNVCNIPGAYRDNIIPYFQSEIDKKYGIDHEKTLTYQYNMYSEQQKRFQDYKPDNIKYLRAHPDELLKKYKKHREALKKTMIRLKGPQYGFVEQDEYIEQNIVDAMEDQYQRAKLYLENRKNTAWVYQDALPHKSSEGTLPVFYTFKFTNGSKLSSHMWFFKGFCQEFNPQYCVLMDVGAYPEKDAIFQLIMSMEQNPKLGGVCGTMRVQIEEDDKDDVELDVVTNILVNKVFSIQKCQSCEYDIAHLLDKQAESALDFIHVLPGAFSAYRYKAFFQNYHDNLNQAENQNQVNRNQMNQYAPVNQNDNQIQINNNPQQINQNDNQIQINNNPQQINQNDNQIQINNNPQQINQNDNQIQINNNQQQINQNDNQIQINNNPQQINQNDNQIQINNNPQQINQNDNQIQINNNPQQINQNDNQNQANGNLPNGQYQNNQEKILDKYLRQVLDQNYEHQTLQEANMFLAEDRVLCKLLYCNGYYLRYIPNSFVYVDPCSSLKLLILQRRRWINGSWHALSYISDNYDEDLKNSRHSWWDKQKFIFSITQAKIQQLMIYFMESFQVLWLYMIMYAIIDTGDLGLNNFIISTIIAFYVFLVFMIIYLSINYDPALIRQLGTPEKQKEEADYYFSRLFFVSTCLGFISLGTVVYTVYLLITEIFFNYGFNDIVEKPQVPQSYYLVLVVVSIGAIILPILSSLCQLPQNIFNAAVTMIPYFYYQPTYMHLFVIYSFCRIDDLSWGTKGLTNTGSSSVNSDKAFQKFKFLLTWLVLNTIFTAVLLILFQIQIYLLPQGLILFISVILTILTIIKGFLALWYRVKFCFIDSQMKSYINQQRIHKAIMDNLNQFNDIKRQLKERIQQNQNIFNQPNSNHLGNSYIRASIFTAFLEHYFKQQN